MRLTLLLVLSGGLSTAFAQTPARTPRPHAPSHACRALTTEVLSGMSLLPEGCYTVGQFTKITNPLTISAGSTITFSGSSELVIETNASLEALGTPAKPIILRGVDGTAGSWNGINVSSRSAHNRFSYVSVEDAGATGRDNAAILLTPGSLLSIDHSTVKRSLSAGIYVMDDAEFGHFEANHFLNNDIPLRVKAGDLVKLDPATTFSDNRNNVVVIPFGEGKLGEDVTWRKLAVPYRFEATVNLEARLTIEAGTELQFRENQSLNVAQNASLTAIGTESAPIVFTGTDDTNGYWGGIFFESASASNILRHVDVRFGGSKASVVGGGIGITHGASAVVQSCAIASSPVGIFVASEGTLNPDAASSNRFVDVGRNIFREP